MAAITRTWTQLNATALDVDSPISELVMNALFDNEVHLREWLGFSFTAGAVQDHNHDGVNSALAAAASIGTAQLKVALSDIGIGDTPGVGNVTHTGGKFIFYPNSLKTTATTYEQRIANTSAGEMAVGVDVANVWLAIGSGGAGHSHANYVTASRPYDLGDGEVGLFLFALIDNASGKVIAVTAAPDPVWLNTRTVLGEAALLHAALSVNIRAGASAAQITALEADLDRIRARGPAEVAALKAGANLAALKLADMPLLPHPFLGMGLAAKTVVLLDPPSDFAHRLLAMHEFTDESPADLLLQDYLRLDNQPLARVTPPGVIAVAPKWKWTP